MKNCSEKGALSGHVIQLPIKTLTSKFGKLSGLLSGFRYLCQQLAYLVFSRQFLIASKIGESLGSYQEYPAKSVGKQGEEFLIAALVIS
jgi:hypothetical protein